MVPVPRILRCPRRPSYYIALLTRTHRGDQNLHKRMPYGPVSLCFLIFEQSQREVYREVLVVGDLTDWDIRWDSMPDLMSFQFGWPSYGRGTSGTAEFVYDNETVYFAQPSLSQFVSGGSGPGFFNRSDPTGKKDALGNTPAPTGKNAPKRDTGAILRYAPPAC